MSSLMSKHLAVLVNCFIECDEEAVDSSMVKLVTQVSNMCTDGHHRGQVLKKVSSYIV